ncbi:MAG: TonB-dependent receptor plug domain-containing protein, partial [Gluconacetobacter diazotrophicus]|nr:TonB-dependent receptor plug domain-containing protein [Gluconacetobacter diazotrophicus]
MTLLAVTPDALARDETGTAQSPGSVSRPAGTAPGSGSAGTGPGTGPGTDGSRSRPEQILVQAERRNRTQLIQGGQLGALGTLSGLDAPFNVRSYTSALIRNQQDETLGQVLENDPTVQTTLGFGNFSEQFVIRGFEVLGDDVSIDGLYGIAPRQLVDPHLFEEVQILNGAG